MQPSWDADEGARPRGGRGLGSHSRSVTQAACVLRPTPPAVPSDLCRAPLPPSLGRLPSSLHFPDTPCNICTPGWHGKLAAISPALGGRKSLSPPALASWPGPLSSKPQPGKGSPGPRVAFLAQPCQGPQLVKAKIWGGRVGAGIQTHGGWGYLRESASSPPPRSQL